MRYQLRDQLSFCRVDDKLVFLDVQNDRYFRLPAVSERAFSLYIDGAESTEAQIRHLVHQGILVETHNAARSDPEPTIHCPRRSAVEKASITQQFDAAAYFEVFALVASTRWRLRRKQLVDILGELVANRQRKATSSGQVGSDLEEENLINAAQVFRSARLYVPMETSCLLDSISMVKFLTRRGLFANIVFAITLDPFSAHCWVQSRDLALNETITDANALTPIRMV